MNNLPEICFAMNDVDNKVVILKKGILGYFNYDNVSNSSVDELNDSIGVTKAQVAAMKVGSMFGWDVPGANPENYDEKGNYIK